MAKHNKTNQASILKTDEDPPITLSRQKKKLFYIAGVCFGLFLGLAFFLYTLQKSIALDKTESFLSQVDSGNYTDAYAQWLSDDYKKQQLLMDFDLNLSLYNELIGSNIKRSLSSISFRQHLLSGTTDITLTFHSKFTKDDNAEEIIALKNSYWHGNWEVESYNIHSDKAVTY